MRSLLPDLAVDGAAVHESEPARKDNLASADAQPAQALGAPGIRRHQDVLGHALGLEGADQAVKLLCGGAPLGTVQ